MERCVADVKKQGKAKNAYAICYESLMRAKKEHGSMEKKN